MNKFVINTFRGGLSKYADRGLSGAFRYGRNLNYRTTENVLTCNQDFLEEGSGVVTDLINFFVPSITGKLYAFGDSGKIYERDNSGNWILKYTDSDGEIKGAIEWYQENGNAYLFWATDTKLHSKEIPGASDWSDVDNDIVIGSNTFSYPKVNLFSADWHTMAIAVGDLYIANGNRLAMVGYDGSYTNEALNIFHNEEIKTLLERGNYLFFGTQRQDKQEISSIYQWDTISVGWNNNKKISLNNINTLIDIDIPLAQVGNRGGIFYTDMVTPLLIRTVNGGGIVNPGAVAVDEGLALFGFYGNSNNDNGIYSFGRKNKDENHTFNLEYYLGQVYEVGALTNFDNKIFVSYKDGGGYHIKRTNLSQKATGVYQSLYLSPDKNFISQHLWRVVKVYLKPLPAGCGISMRYRLGGKNNNSWQEANLENKTNIFNITNGTEAVFFVGEKSNIFEFELTLNPSGNNAPEIQSIEVYFD